MTSEQEKKIDKVIQILKTKTKDWGIIAMSVRTYKMIDQSLEILESNPQISIAEFMEKMGITDEDEEI